jgi:hypothetical protein
MVLYIQVMCFPWNCTRESEINKKPVNIGVGDSLGTWTKTGSVSAPFQVRVQVKVRVGLRITEAEADYEVELAKMFLTLRKVYLRPSTTFFELFCPSLGSGAVNLRHGFKFKLMVESWTGSDIPGNSEVTEHGSTLTKTLNPFKFTERMTLTH